MISQYIAAITAAIGAFSLGLVLAWANVVQTEFETGRYNFPCSAEEFSWISSVFVLGAMCVCIPSGFFINMIGRKWTIIAMCIPCITGWFLVIIANNIILMYIARFVLGFASASYCVSVPVYTGEIAQKEIRGLLGTLFQFMIVCGILFMYIIGGLMHAGMVGMISAVFPVVLGVLMFFMPESPTYLIKKGMAENATKSFAWLRGKGYDATAEIDDVKAAEAGEKVSIVEAFKRPETIRAFIISSALMVFQQLCGINAVIFYSTAIFIDANTGFSPAFSTMLIGVVQVFATFASMMLVDRLGRRTLLLVSAIGMALCTLCIGIYFFIKDSGSGSTASIGWLPVTSLCFFITFFSIGYGPIPWLMLGEIFSTDIKGFAGSISATMNWLFAFIVTKTFVNLKDLMGTGGTFMLFTAITVFGVFFVWFMVIETKGKSLNEIQAELVSKNKPKPKE